MSTFSSLKPLLRRIVLRVHPDVITHLPPACATTNAASLQTLFRFFDTLRCSLPAEARAGAPEALKPQPFSESYKFEFWHELREESDLGGEGSAAPPQPLLLQREMRMPPGLERRCAQLVKGGCGLAASAHLLGLGKDTIAVLGEGLGLLPRGALQLSPALREALREGARETPGARAGSGMDPSSAMDMQRAHLAAQSPLQQGKDQSSAPPTMEGAHRLVAGTPPSVFTLPQRRRRVDGLLSKPGWLSIHCGGKEEQVNAAALRLRSMLIRNFDGLLLFHALWPTLRLALAPGCAWHADPASGSLSIPLGHTEAELLHFVTHSWDAICKKRGGFSDRRDAARANKN